LSSTTWSSPGSRPGDAPRRGDGDAQYDALRRLIAWAWARARKSVIVGFKPDDPSAVLSLLRPDTFELVTL